MRSFLEKLLIIVLCLYNFYIINPGSNIVFPFILSLIISLLLDLLNDTKYRYLPYFLFLSLLFLNTKFIIYLPLIFYNLYMDFGLYSIMASALILIDFSFSTLLTIGTSLAISATAKAFDWLMEENKTTRDSLMEDIRKSIHNLYKESFDLESRIYELIQDMSGLYLDLNYGIRDELNHELAFDIFSIVKESITNSVKHSNADRINISLLEQPSFYSISIRDNGDDFNHRENIFDKGIGLASMKEIANKYNGLEAIKLYDKHRPDLILMDIRMEKLNGLEATKEILKKDPQAKILLITTFQDDDYIDAALALGCKGYILKQNIEGIIPAIRAVDSGNLVFDSKIISSIKSHSKEFHNSNLSPRELDILLLIADGLNNKEIADELFLSEGTVRNYISNMLDKLDLRDRTQLAIYYYKNK